MVMKIEIVRPDDLLNLRVQAINLRLDADIDPENPNKPVLVVEDLQQPSYLIVTFPPQAIAEGAYFQASWINLVTRMRIRGDKLALYLGVLADSFSKCLRLQEYHFLSKGCLIGQI